jgi:hypothetical protein
MPGFFPRGELAYLSNLSGRLGTEGDNLGEWQDVVTNHLAQLGMIAYNA